MDTIKEGIVGILIQIGVRTDLYGFQYLVDILDILRKGDGNIHGGMMELYKVVAIKNNTTYKNVESRIRSAIESTFEQGNTDELYKLFGSTISRDKAKPTNKQFISTILWYLK